MSQSPPTPFPLRESQEGRKAQLVLGPGVIVSIVIFTGDSSLALRNLRLIWNWSFSTTDHHSYQALFAVAIISFCLVARKRSDSPPVTPPSLPQPRPTNTMKRSTTVLPFRRASLRTVSSSYSSQFNPRDSQSTLVNIPNHVYELDEVSLPRPSQAHIRNSQFTHHIPPGLV